MNMIRVAKLCPLRRFGAAVSYSLCTIPIYFFYGIIYLSFNRQWPPEFWYRFHSALVWCSVCVISYSIVLRISVNSLIILHIKGIVYKHLFITLFCVIYQLHSSSNTGSLSIRHERENGRRHGRKYRHGQARGRGTGVDTGTGSGAGTGRVAGTDAGSDIVIFQKHMGVRGRKEWATKREQYASF